MRSRSQRDEHYARFISHSYQVSTDRVIIVNRFLPLLMRVEVCIVAAIAAGLKRRERKKKLSREKWHRAPRGSDRGIVAREPSAGGGRKEELLGEGAPLFVRSRCHCSRLPLLIHCLRAHILCLSLSNLNEIELQQKFDQTKVGIRGTKKQRRNVVIDTPENHVSLCFFCA